MLKNLIARSLAVEKNIKVDVSNSFQNVDMIDHHTHNLSSCEIKREKNSGLNRIQTHDLCNTSAVF